MADHPSGGSHVGRNLMLFWRRLRQAVAEHKKLENTDMYTQIINFESDEWYVAHARTLEEESKLIEAGFEYVRYSDKDAVAIYRKRKWPQYSSPGLR